MKHKPYTLAICLSILFLFCFISLALVQHLSTKKDNVVPLTYNWCYSLNGRPPVSLCLPTHVSSYYHKGDIIDLYTTLPNTSLRSPSLCTKIFLEDVKIFLDGKLLYTYEGDMNFQGTKEVGSGILVLPLPKDYAYKSLHIQYVHHFNHVTNYIFPITLTEKNLAQILLFESAESFYLNGCFLLIGFICVLISGYRKLKKHSWLNFLFLGLFAIIYATWSLCNSKLLQLITNNLALIHFSEYVSFYLCTIPLWLFFYTIVQERVLKRYCFISAMPSIAFFIITLALHCLTSINFFQLLSIYHLILVGNLLLIMLLMLILIYKKHSLSKGLLIGMLFLVLSCILQLIKFYTTNIKIISFVDYGIILFFFNLIYALYHPLKSEPKAMALQKRTIHY